MNQNGTSQRALAEISKSVGGSRRGSAIEENEHIAAMRGWWQEALRIPTFTMSPNRDGEEAEARRAMLRARKLAQADEGRAAMADYVRGQQATIDRTAKLKAQRLVQQALPTEPPKKKKVGAKKAVKRA